MNAQDADGPPTGQELSTTVTGTVIEKRIFAAGVLYIALQREVGSGGGVIDVLITPLKQTLAEVKRLKSEVKFGATCSCVGVVQTEERLTEEQRHRKRNLPPAQYVLRCSEVTVLENSEPTPAERIKKTLQRTGLKYWCNVCSCGCQTPSAFERHMVGQRHHKVAHEQTEVWSKFCAQAPSWAEGDEENSAHVTPTWQDSEISNFPMGTTRLEPSTKFHELSSLLKVRFWRYLNDRFGSHSPEIGAIFHELGNTVPECMRVKELIESIESYLVISKFIVMAQNLGHKVEKIFDVACGHGLVGVLLGYRFDTAEVICVDLEKRPVFAAYVNAWGLKGVKSEGTDHPLHNVRFLEADLATIGPQLTAASIVVATHACNDANASAVELARAHGALWSVMPCCVAQGLYLPRCSVSVRDEARHMLMCGALASNYGGQFIREIDRCITNRNIMVAGGLHEDECPERGPAHSAPSHQDDS